MGERPYVTSFMLASADGKISFADGVIPDFDRHIPMCKGASAGLKQYYNIEENTDDVSIISGAICMKLADEFSNYSGNKIDCTCVIVDRSGIVSTNVLAGLGRKFRLVIHYSSIKFNPNVRESELASRGVVNVMFQRFTSLQWMMEELYKMYGVKRATLQTGGTLNAEFMRCGLIDELDYVVAPIVCGGKTTPTLFDGDAFAVCGEDSIEGEKELRLLGVSALYGSYYRVRYMVIHNTAEEYKCQN